MSTLEDLKAKAQAAIDDRAEWLIRIVVGDAAAGGDSGAGEEEDAGRLAQKRHEAVVRFHQESISSLWLPAL